MEDSQALPTPMSHAAFPPVGALFSQSWTTFKQSLLWLFVITLGGWGAIAVLVILAVLIGIASGLGAAFSSQGGNLGALLGPSLGILILDVVVFVVGLIIVGSVMQIGAILIVGSDKANFSFGQAVKRSFGLIVPFFLTQWLVGILVIGGFFVFIVPAIIIGYLFMFVMFVVVFEQQRFTSALRRSIALMTHNFGDVFARYLLLIGMSIIFAIIVFFVSLFVGLGLGVSSAFSKDAAAAGFGGLQLLFNLFIQIISALWGWYVLSYLYTLYKHASDSTPKDKKVNIGWIWSVAIVGWIIAILVGWFAISAIGDAAKSGTLQKWFEESKKSESTSSKTKETSPEQDTLKTGNTKLTTAFQLLDKPNLTESQRQQAIALINGAIEDYKIVTEQEPKNAVAWYNLGYAYGAVIAVTPNADRFAIDSYKKAIALKSDYYDAYLALGGVYYQTKDYNQAITAFQTATTLEPKNANAYYNLGLAYKQYGAKKQAKAALQKALDLLPANDPTRYKAETEIQGL